MSTSDNDMLYISNPHDESLEERETFFLFLKKELPAEEFKKLSMQDLMYWFWRSFTRSLEKWNLTLESVGQDMIDELTRREAKAKAEKDEQ